MDQAIEWAKLGYDGKVTEEIITLARDAAAAWSKLADQLEEEERRRLLQTTASILRPRCGGRRDDFRRSRKPSTSTRCRPPSALT